MSIDKIEQFEKLKAIGTVVANCLALMKAKARVGMTTAELDEIGARYLASMGARSAPRAVYDFPGSTCISVDFEAAHGVPGDRVLREGDLVNVDVSGELGGFWADTGSSFVLGKGSAIKRQLCTVSQRALDNAMAAARAGESINVIGKAIEETAAAEGFTVLRNLGSHGVGGGLHEEPTFIAGFNNPRERRKLTKNLVITIEPFVSNGATQVSEKADGWTLHHPRYMTAQQEHTMVITDGAPTVMTHPDKTFD